MPVIRDRKGVPPNVPRRLPDLVQLRSTLMPTLDFHSLYAVPVHATSMQKMWQKRVYDLRDAGWGPLVHPLATMNRLVKMVDCLPTFVINTGRGRRPCRVNQVCPFCHARSVREAWLSIDRAFFTNMAPLLDDDSLKPRHRAIEVEPSPGPCEWHGRTFRSESDLVTRSFTVPFEIRNESLPGEYIAQSMIRSAGIKRIIAPAKSDGRPCGAVETIYVEYTKPGTWLFHVKQLFLLPPGRPLDLTRSGNKGTVKRIESPARTDVMKAVAKTLQYQRFLLDFAVPATAVRDYLEARAGLKTRSMFGCFRQG